MRYFKSHGNNPSTHKRSKQLFVIVKRKNVLTLAKNLIKLYEKAKKDKEDVVFVGFAGEWEK